MDREVISESCLSISPRCLKTTTLISEENMPLYSAIQQRRFQSAPRRNISDGSYDIAASDNLMHIFVFLAYNSNHPQRSAHVFNSSIVGHLP